LAIKDADAENSALQKVIERSRELPVLTAHTSSYVNPPPQPSQIGAGHLRDSGGNS
jgi:hypothetical protein